jgi:hypothetical protein
MVPQAMSGQLSQSGAPADELHLRESHRRKDRKKEISVQNAMIELFTGIGFVVVAISILTLVPHGEFWWWSFLIPAFALVGAGVGEYLRWKEIQRQQILPDRPGDRSFAYQQAFPQALEVAPPTTSELAKPSSVTEHTTRHLE